ncbi:hypothetical protein LINPERHAP1_LOCUS33555 [Linum perenne]
MQQNSSSLTWDPTYEAFVGGCKLREVVRVLGVTPCKELITTLIESYPEVVTIYARAYTWVLVGSVLLADRTRDHIPANLLTLLGDPGVAATFNWGSVDVLWRCVTPMICFDAVSWHHPDNCLRQFHIEQRIPQHVEPGAMWRCFWPRILGQMCGI